jgi:hypothetical protein
VSILPCDLDPTSLGVVVDGYWDLDGLREHVKVCDLCECVRDAMAAMTGSQGGKTGRGAAKRRGDSEHYRRLAFQSWRDE